MCVTYCTIKLILFLSNKQIVLTSTNDPLVVLLLGSCCVSMGCAGIKVMLYLFFFFFFFFFVRCGRELLLWHEMICWLILVQVFLLSVFFLLLLFFNFFLRMIHTLSLSLSLHCMSYTMHTFTMLYL